MGGGQLGLGDITYTGLHVPMHFQWSISLYQGWNKIKVIFHPKFRSALSLKTKIYMFSVDFYGVLVIWDIYIIPFKRAGKIKTSLGI